MTDVLSPLDVLERAFLFISIVWNNHIPKIPGAVITKLSPEQRKILSHLQSNDINCVYNLNRWIMSSISEEDDPQVRFRNLIKNEKTLFDKKMK